MARWTAVATAALAICLLWSADRPREQRYQDAVELFESKGDIPGAMKLFEEAARSPDRDLASRALLYLGTCYEKLGQAGAGNTYRRILREFADEPAAAQARARLARLEKETAGAIVARRIERAGRTFSAIETDGERLVYRDTASGDILYGDVAGRSKRVVFKSRPGALSHWVPSLDFSMVALVFNSGPDRPRSIAVVNIDGTGYRELARNDETGGDRSLAFDRVRRVSWSWDNRHLLVLVPANHELDSGRLLVVSVADGKRRKLIDAEPGMLWGGVFSPDGRFVAYEVVNWLNPAPERTFVVPVEGGKPSLIHEEPRGRLSDSGILDWTADGRYLAISSPAGGAFALHLFPVENGQPSGAPIPLRPGHFVWGRTTRAGALICELSAEVRYTAQVASLDPEGKVGTWEPLKLREPPLDPVLDARWSPDSARILYTARNQDLGQSAARIVRVHDVATGQDREVHRTPNIAACMWAREPSGIFCRDLAPGAPAGTSSVYSLSLKSGAIEPLTTYSGPTFLVRASRDGAALYLINADLAADTGRLARWDIAGKRETVLMTGSPRSSAMPRLTPDERWIVWADGFKLQARPASGGDWKALATVSRAATTNSFATEFAPAADSRSVLYHDVDATGRHGLFRVPISGGAPERLGDYACPAAWFGNLEVSPDGRKVLAESVSPEQQTEIWLLRNFAPVSPKR